MGLRANFIIVEDSIASLHHSQWAAGSFDGDMFWGPEHFAAFIASQPPVASWADHTWCDGGALLDGDSTTLLWFGGMDDLIGEIEYRRTYQELLATRWPGWTIRWAANGYHDFIDHLGVDHSLVSGPVGAAADHVAQRIRFVPEELRTGRPTRTLLSIASEQGSLVIGAMSPVAEMLRSGPEVLQIPTMAFQRLDHPLLPQPPLSDFSWYSASLPGTEEATGTGRHGTDLNGPGPNRTGPEGTKPNGTEPNGTEPKRTGQTGTGGNDTPVFVLSEMVEEGLHLDLAQRRLFWWETRSTHDARLTEQWRGWETTSWGDSFERHLDLLGSRVSTSSSDDQLLTHRVVDWLIRHDGDDYIDLFVSAIAQPGHHRPKARKHRGPEVEAKVEAEANTAAAATEWTTIRAEASTDPNAAPNAGSETGDAPSAPVKVTQPATDHPTGSSGDNGDQGNELPTPQELKKANDERAGHSRKKPRSVGPPATSARGPQRSKKPTTQAVNRPVKADTVESPPNLADRSPQNTNPGTIVEAEPITIDLTSGPDDGDLSVEVPSLVSSNAGKVALLTESLEHTGRQMPELNERYSRSS